ncbi:acyltransferase family protein [uncultured Thiodictyon sp.]|uniref:acyltransferase family protein n=1 Tax=uncultured Thiodictyon sp. TaxID=1846217 RepID=UPI0025F4A693|nr:acyltransferase family protein [uncultured Thiodictyon sp.]
MIIAWRRYRGPVDARIAPDQEATLPPPSAHLMHPKYRADIDGLRAVAVLAVVAFHAFHRSVPGGFIGVDIFFVISGFLISGIIFSSLERDAFSFSEFYSRRIRRIFPALLVVLIFCFAFGWFALLATEYQQLGKHMAAGAGFVANLVLWSESGYFDVAAETKPLLHLWSLGIEEQFYIVWPFLVWAAWKMRFNLLMIMLVAAGVSFALNLTTYRSDGVADFYSPQTRFWELLVGSALAYGTHHSSQLLPQCQALLDGLLGRLRCAPMPASSAVTLRNALSMLGALFIITGLAVITKDVHFPGTWVILPVLGTVMIIGAGRHAWLNRVVLSHRILVWFGRISFPLYLWHWPLLSFGRIIETKPPGQSLRTAAVAIAIVLAWLTYKLIERPLRFGKQNNVRGPVLVVLMICVGSLGYYTYQSEGLHFRPPIKAMDAVLEFVKWQDTDDADPVCRKRFGYHYKYCRLASDKSPSVALIGDSFANSYFPGLASEYNKLGDNLVMLGGSGCPPLIDITSGFAGEVDWCNSMGSNAIRVVAGRPDVRTVVLAANWHLYINGNRFSRRYDRAWEIRSKVPGDDSNVMVFSGKIRETIAFLVSAGKKVIIMKQTPEMEIDPVNCIITRPLVFHKVEKKCEVPAALVMSYLNEYESIFDAAIVGDASVSVLDPYPIFCTATSCPIMDGDYPLYRDDLHLSLHGSRYLASRLKLSPD